MPRRRKRGQPLIGLSLFLLFCLLLSGYFFINSAFFNLREIKVKGCVALAEPLVRDLSGITPGTNLFHLDKPEALQRVVLHPVIKTARIFRKIPHTVIIVVEERVPLALLVGTDEYLVIDAEGVYLQKVEDFMNIDLPVLSGVPLPSGVSPGEKISTAGLDAALRLLEMMAPDFLKNVAEIEAATPYNLTLKMLQGVKIHFGSTEEIARKLHLIQELLVENEESINQQTVEYIDLRYKSLPVIKRKNEKD